MEQFFKEVKAINKKDKVGIELALCKLFEESGELAQAVNMIIGRKASKLTDKEIKSLVTEECIDTIQNVFCIADKAGITYKDLCAVFGAKNAKWKSRISKKEINLTGNTKVKTPTVKNSTKKVVSK